MLRRLLRLLTLVFAFSAAASCSSSSSTDVRGDGGSSELACTYDAGTWTCPAPIGNYRACSLTESPTASCTIGATPCFSCLYDHVAGAVCTCMVTDGAMPSWTCIGTETACAGQGP